VGKLNKFNRDNTQPELVMIKKSEVILLFPQQIIQSTDRQDPKSKSAGAVQRAGNSVGSVGQVFFEINQTQRAAIGNRSSQSL